MPVINGLQLSQVNDANAAFALAFFPRTKKLHYPKLCGNTRSSRLVEPFTLAGSAPIMQAYNGMLKSMGLKSYKSLVPNLLFKNFEEIDRTELEMDQTRTLRSRAAQFGSRVAEYPDYLLAKRILNGSTAGSQTVVFQGVSYTQTFDGVPFFSASHPHSGTNQSNIIQGTLPNVAATAQANIAQSAAQMQSDLAILVDAICGVKDDKGAPMYPDFDAKTQLIVVVPPALDTIATLAFLTPGVIGGLTTSGTGSNGSSTNLGPQMVKEVVKMGLLKGCPDIEADDPYSTTISPVNPTDWYAFIDGDYVQARSIGNGSCRSAATRSSRSARGRTPRPRRGHPRVGEQRRPERLDRVGRGVRFDRDRYQLRRARRQRADVGREGREVLHLRPGAGPDHVRPVVHRLAGQAGRRVVTAQAPITD
jgi:hypothetical protein